MRDRSDANRMPIAETYREVGIHDFQPRERIDRVVKPAIDAVYGLSDGLALLAYARDPQHPPEARLFAAARIEAIWDLAAENREARPEVKPDKAQVATAGLDSLRWANPRRYGSLLEPGPMPGERRLQRDQRSREAMEQARSAHAAGDRTSLMAKAKDWAEEPW